MAICPYKGRSIQRSQLMNELPERFKNAASKECEVNWQLQSPIVVLDPLELSHNITKGISKSLLKIVVSYFMESSQLIFFEPSSQVATGNNSTTENNNTVTDGGE